MFLIGKIRNRYRRFVERRLRSEIFDKFKEFTMITEECYIANLELVERFRSGGPKGGIKGSVVECGTWRGGMIAGIAKLLGQDRHYHLFDSFEGLPPAQEIDGQGAVAWQADKESSTYYDNCSAPKEVALEAMSLSGCKNPLIYKGWFGDVLPDVKIDGGIAILRMDADWYESTMDILENLFDQVNLGGLIIVDDYYTWDGCSKAVHDYLSKNKCVERIHRHKGVCFMVKEG